MRTVIKGTKTVEEFKQTRKRMEELAELAYRRHQKFCENWENGKPVKAWFEDECEICVEYENGQYWHYKDLDLPFPTWW